MNIITIMEQRAKLIRSCCYKSRYLFHSFIKVSYHRNNFESLRAKTHREMMIDESVYCYRPQQKVKDLGLYASTKACYRNQRTHFPFAAVSVYFFNYYMNVALYNSKRP